MKQDRTLFDNQISEALAGHTTAPSAALREALMARMAAMPPRRKAWYLRRKVQLLASALLLAPALVYLIVVLSVDSTLVTHAPLAVTVSPMVQTDAPNQQASTTESTPEFVANEPTTAVSTQALTINHANAHANHINADASTATSQQHEAVKLRNVAVDELGGQSNVAESQAVSQVSVAPTVEVKMSSQNSTRSQGKFLFGLAPLKKGLLSGSHESRFSPQAITMSKPVVSRRPADDLPQSSVFVRHDGRFTAGLSYTPEIMFNVLDDDQKFVHNIALEFQYHYFDFTIRTGLGLAFAKGVSAIEVEYRSFKGSYQHLDSLDFVYDMQSEQLVAVYHTSERNVYDSVTSDAITKIENEYTYLQIPLIFGYQIFENSRFGVSALAGPTLSMLLSTKQNNTYDPGKNLIINTNTLSSDRIKTNWQFGAGIGFSYHLTPKLAIELEPRVKYYFNSVYEKAATIRKPWSLELRSGVLYTF